MSLVPQTCVNEALQRLPTALNKKTLHATGPQVSQCLLPGRVGKHIAVAHRSMAKYHAQGTVACPLPHIQAGIVQLPCAMPNKYGLMFGSQLVYQSLRDGGGKTDRRLTVIQTQMGDVAIVALRPLQGDIGAMPGVESNESAVEPQALLFQHTNPNLATRLAQHGDATSIDLGKGVATAYYDRRNAFVDDELCTGRGLTIVGTGLQADVDGAPAEQMRLSDRTDGIDLSMSLATFPVIALTDDTSVANHHRTHHGIGGSPHASALGQLQAAPHKLFVYFALFHKKLSTFNFQLSTFNYLCSMKTFQQIVHDLRLVYPEGEARALARWLCEERFGLSQTDILLDKDNQLSAHDLANVREITQRLIQGEPIQYILGHTTFCGHKFTVAPGALIPRPETQDLVDMAAEEVRNRPAPMQILDVGTGTGCIAISLALALPQAEVTGWDVSPEALDVARKNAERYPKAHVTLEQQDIFSPPNDQRQWQMIVSNPPYIRQSEAKEMERNVLHHEPHLALFVPDDNPLLYYRAILWYAMRHLAPNGSIWFEINQAMDEEMYHLIEYFGFQDIEILKDSFGRNRFARCRKGS